MSGRSRCSAASALNAASNDPFSNGPRHAAAPVWQDASNILLECLLAEGRQRRSGRMAIVLVVEDDADIREVMIEALAGAGHRAETAASGAAALTRLRDGGPRPQLILLDNNMAGMNGPA